MKMQCKQFHLFNYWGTRRQISDKDNDKDKKLYIYTQAYTYIRELYVLKNKYTIEQNVKFKQNVCKKNYKLYFEQKLWEMQKKKQ